MRAVSAPVASRWRMIYTEALVMAVVATAGIGGGILVARGLLAVFKAAAPASPTRRPCCCRP